jgi:hypothetical protein
MFKIIPKQTEKLADRRVQSAEFQRSQTALYCINTMPFAIAEIRQLSIPPIGQFFSLFGYSLKIIGFLLAFILLKQFCYRQTDGFALYKICSSLSYCSDWETTPSLSQDNEREIAPILDQPFYYLAKGAQSYVFASADGKTVIKFFRIYHLRPPIWLTALQLPLPLQSYKIRKMIEKNLELEKDFQSYKIAFQELKDETGLHYLHLNKTHHLKKSLTIYDKIGIAYQLDLDQMEFLIQKKASLVFPSIEHLINTEGVDAAKEAISALVKLLVKRCEKGIFDKDPDLNTNFGFLHKVPVQIDVGRFRKEQAGQAPEDYRNEVIRITDNFRQWLDQNHPSLSEHLLKEIQYL